MSNHQNKPRVPVSENAERSTEKSGVRKKIGAQIKMDMSAYISAYPDKKLMLINDLDGDVARWLDAGAEPIQSKLAGRKIYKGLNDKADNEWVKFVAGQLPTGEAYYAYGLMMDPDLYDDYKLAPQRKRQEDIRNAMIRGHSQENGQFESGQDLKSYAPNLPTGEGKGYNQIRSK